MRSMNPACKAATQIDEGNKIAHRAQKRQVKNIPKIRIFLRFNEPMVAVIESDITGVIARSSLPLSAYLSCVQPPPDVSTPLQYLEFPQVSFGEMPNCPPIESTQQGRFDVPVGLLEQEMPKPWRVQKPKLELRLFTATRRAEEKFHGLMWDIEAGRKSGAACSAGLELLPRHILKRKMSVFPSPSLEICSMHFSDITNSSDISWNVDLSTLKPAPFCNQKHVIAAGVANEKLSIARPHAVSMENSHFNTEKNIHSIYHAYITEITPMIGIFGDGRKPRFIISAPSFCDWIDGFAVHDFHINQMYTACRKAQTTISLQIHHEDIFDKLKMHDCSFDRSATFCSRFKTLVMMPMIGVNTAGNNIGAKVLNESQLFNVSAPIKRLRHTIKCGYGSLLGVHQLILPMVPLYHTVGSSFSAAPRTVFDIFPSILEMSTERDDFSVSKSDERPEDILAKTSSRFWHFIGSEIQTEEEFFTLPLVDMPRHLAAIAHIREDFESKWIPLLLDQVKDYTVKSSIQTYSIYLDWSLSIKKEEFRSRDVIAACCSADTKVKYFPTQNTDGSSSVQEYDHTQHCKLIIKYLLDNFLDLSCEALANYSGEGKLTLRRKGMSSCSIQPSCENDAKRNMSNAFQYKDSIQQSADECESTVANKRQKLDLTKTNQGLRMLLDLQGRGDLGKKFQTCGEVNEQEQPTWSDTSSSPEDFSISNMHIKLCGEVLELFQQLNSDDTRLKETELMPLLNALPPKLVPQLSISDFPEAENLRELLDSVQKLKFSDSNKLRGSKETVSTKQCLIRIIASMAVLRQTGSLLLHHGIRCAWTFCSISLEEMPLSICSMTSISSLKDASRAVERGEVSDSGKHVELRRSLITINALHVVSSLKDSSFRIFQNVRRLHTYRINRYGIFWEKKQQ